MFLLKILTVAAVGLLAFRMLTVMFAKMQARRAQVKAEREPAKATRLARDPRTGIYYPEQ